MTYTLQDYRTLTRAQLDLDETDLPDTLIDVWVREGDGRIHNHRLRWPWREVRTYIVTAEGQADYDWSTSTLAEIASMRGTQRLELLPRDVADEWYAQGHTETGEPRYWSEWADEVRLYPTPNAVYYIEVRGYLKRQDWISEGAGGTPPYPEELHNALLQWVYSKAYQQQGDPESSVFHLDLFDDELTKAAKTLDQTPTPQPLVLGGGPTLSQSSGIGRLRYPWES